MFLTVGNEFCKFLKLFAVLLFFILVMGVLPAFIHFENSKTYIVALNPKFPRNHCIRLFDYDGICPSLP